MPYFEYYYNFPFDSEAMELFAAFYGLVASFGGILGLVCYVFRAISLYTIAQRRGLNHPWLAWVPVGFEWLLGSVSDQYQYLVKERNTSRRKLMLCFSIITLLSGLVVFVIAVAMVVRLVISAPMMTEAQIAQMILGPVMTVLVFSMILSVIAIVLLVFRCISMYDLYRSCQPDNAVLYLVLGIFFNFLEPVFVMLVRKKDEGMPPRKPEPVYHALDTEYQTSESAEQKPQEPWAQEE